MMINKEIKKMIWTSIFWGALWGIVEATLGYMAHMAAVIPGIAGFIMFPIGFYFMSRTLRATGKLWTVFGAASIAACVKLVDLFLPALNPIYTINPAVCILIEALAVIAVYRFMIGEKRIHIPFRFKEAFSAAFGWRIAFLVYSSALVVFSISQESITLLGTGHILRFLLLESIINAFIIAAYLKIEKSIKSIFSPPIRIRPAFAFSMFTFAIFYKLLLAFL